MRGADQDVGEAVAVHVAAVGGVAQAGAGLVALDLPVQARRRRAAQEQEGGALVGLVVLPAAGAHEEVGVAVAVDVAGLGEVVPEVGRRAGQAGLVAPARGGAQAAGAAVVEPDPAVVAPVGGAHHHVGVAVSVHVTDAGHRAAEVGAAAGSRRSRRPVGGAAQAGEAAVEHVGHADVGLVRVPEGQVAVAVPVDVARCGHRPAEVGASRRVVGPVRRRRQRGEGGVAVPDVDRPAGACLDGGSHRQVAQTVPVQVARAGQVVAEVHVGGGRGQGHRR